jgi:thiamine-monophosphate kinase
MIHGIRVLKAAFRNKCIPMKDNKPLEISELGEFGLINHLTKDFTTINPSTVKSIGDDCAVIDYKGDLIVVSTDMLVSNVHFDLMYTPLKHLGYKSIIAGISDIYAMNASAQQVLVSIAISNQFSVELIEELYSGMTTACKNYEVDFVGGDTTTIQQGIVINVTAMGKAKKDALVYRNGAKKNELICVTGDLGAAYTGLLILEREKRVFMESSDIQPELEGFEYGLFRQLKPEARKDIIETFRELELKPTAMIDVSDGLSSDIIHICKQSGVGCKLFEDKIPIDPQTYQTARDLNLDPTTCTLNGGEDYELLFTIKQEDFDKIKNHPDFSVIGHTTAQEGDYRLITKGGNEHPLEALGWKVFGTAE